MGYVLRETRLRIAQQRTPHKNQIEGSPGTKSAPVAEILYLLVVIVLTYGAILSLVMDAESIRVVFHNH